MDPKDDKDKKDTPVMAVGFATQKEFDDFLNGERTKIRDEETRKVQKTIDSLRTKAESKETPEMTDEQIAKIVNEAVTKAVSEAVQQTTDKVTKEITKQTEERFKKMSEEVNNGFRSSKKERLLDILETEKAKYGEEVVEELLENYIDEEKITGDETPAEIRETFKKANAAYKRIKGTTEAPKTEEKPEEKKTEPPKSKQDDEEKKKTEDTPAPGVRGSSNSNEPPPLDGNTTRAQALAELKKIDPVREPKKYAERREHFKNVLGN